MLFFSLDLLVLATRFLLFVFLFGSAISAQEQSHQLFLRHNLRIKNSRIDRGYYPTHKYVKNRGRVLNFLSSKRIQNELEVTKTQLKSWSRLRKTRNDLVDRTRSQHDWKNISENEIKQVAKKISDLNAQFDTKAFSELVSHQRDRMLQLLVWEQIWAHGMLSLLCEPPIARRFGVTPEVKNKLIELAKKLDKEIDWSIQEFPILIRTELEKSLNAKQKKKLNTLIGPNEIVKNWPQRSVNDHLRNRLLLGFSRTELQEFGLEITACPLRPQLKKTPIRQYERFPNKVFVLMSPTVAKQLEITAGQLKGIRMQHTRFLSELRTVEKTQFQSKEKQREAAMKKADRFEKSVREILLPHQVELLNKAYYWKQIFENGLYLSLVGLNRRAKYLKPGSIGSELELTDEQIARLKKDAEVVAKELLIKRRDLQHRSVFGFLDLLPVEHKAEIKKLLGKMPQENALPDLHSIRLQLLHVTAPRK